MTRWSYSYLYIVIITELVILFHKKFGKIKKNSEILVLPSNDPSPHCNDDLKRDKGIGIILKSAILPRSKTGTMWAVQVV